MAEEKQYLLGIDIGTTNVKGIIMSGTGQVIASASRTNVLVFPGAGMVEQDADSWWRNVTAILQSVTRQAGSDIVKKISGISVSSQTVTMLPVDKDGRPLRNALIWMDSRSSSEVQQIIQETGYSRFVSIVGARPDVAFLPNKILWYRKHEPGLFSKTYRILQASSYINYKLTDQMTMDIDQAVRSQCMNCTSLKWSDEISHAIGVDLNSLLPVPERTESIIGTVTERAASETGLLSGVPVVAGCSDAMASLYATGLCKLGEAGESSGTSSLVFIGHDKPSLPDASVVTKPCGIQGMPYVFDAPINTSGAAIKWYQDTFGKEECSYAASRNTDPYTHMKELAAESRPGSNGILFFPYLHGERAPLWNDYARGMFIGMTLHSERKDIFRSVFEGTAFALRHVIAAIQESGAKVECLRITGGGAKNRIWSRIKASMLHVPVWILDEKSGDVPFGDALIAGYAAGVFQNLSQSINSLIQVKEVIQPVEEWESVYDKLYPLFTAMYSHLDDDLKELKKITESVQENNFQN
jgi:xylulokinase